MVAGGARPGLTEKKPHAMKKLLFAALLSLAGVGLSTERASAWLFCHHCCHGSTTICCKPYNAFTPSVFGSITADGCCPISFGGCGAGGMPPPPPWMCGPPPWACGPSCDGGCSGPEKEKEKKSTTMTGPAVGTPMMLPGVAAPQYQVPAPMPAGSVAPATAPGYPTGIQGAAYRSVVPTGYAPLPMMQPNAYPSYWNTTPNGR
jgi:hypothetical protein